MAEQVTSGVVKVAVGPGDYIEVEAVFIGPFAIHKRLWGDEYRITHIASGLAVGWPYKSQKTAKRMAKKLVPLGDWDKAARAYANRKSAALKALTKKARKILGLPPKEPRSPDRVTMADLKKYLSERATTPPAVSSQE